MLILVMLITWAGHLSTLVAAVHLPDQVVSVVDEHSHDHGAQSLHQRADIGHQHTANTPDHLHDSVKLPEPPTESLPLSRSRNDVVVRLVWPSAPLFLIERPPKQLS